MSDGIKIFRVLEALAGVLAGHPGTFWPEVRLNEDTPSEPPQAPWLNVAIPPGRTQILEEVLGLGEDRPLIRFAQIYHLEWIVRRNDKARREEIFFGGLRAFEDALYADRLLGGLAKGLEIGAPDFTGHKYVLHPDTSAASVPVRVIMTGRSTLS
jgi:hypothetical protein